MEEVVTQRLRTAAEIASNEPGWNITIQPDGIRITYTWQHLSLHPFTSRPMLSNIYTVENITGWESIKQAKNNPLLTAMDSLITQRTEFKP